MDFTGTIHKIFDEVHRTATFKTRDVVLETSETKGDTTYTELVSFQFIQDKCDLLNKYKVGDSVEVGFNLKGRKWTSPQGEDKYFNTLQAWMIHSEKGEESGLPQAAPAPAQMDSGARSPITPADQVSDDSLDPVPF
jgi:hypothetical protein